MSSPRNDSGATIPARGQHRAAAAATPAPATATLTRISNALPPKLRGVPLPALLSWAGLGTIVVTTLFLVAVRSAGAIEALEEDEAAAPVTSASAIASSAPGSSAAPAAKPTAQHASATAKKEELDAARLAGTEAIAALAQRYPEDPAVLKALFLAQARDQKAYGPALRTARHLVEVSPEAGQDADVSSTLVNLANGPTDTMPVALDVMAAMGARGAELLFEVAGGPVLLSKARAAQLLRDPAVRRNASPALLVAYDLLESRPCARKAHVARAKSDGDARALPLLKPLVDPTACGGGGGFFRRGGRGECLRCFTPEDKKEIQAAISAIEARVGGSPASSASAEP